MEQEKNWGEKAMYFGGKPFRVPGHKKTQILKLPGPPDPWEKRGMSKKAHQQALRVTGCM